MSDQQKELYKYISEREKNTHLLLQELGFPTDHREGSIKKGLPTKVKRAYAVLEAAEDLKSALTSEDQYLSANKGIEFAIKIAILNHENLRPIFETQHLKKASNKRYGKARDLYLQATETVILMLKNGDHTDWKHTDYTHYIHSMEKFHSLNRNSLRKKIKEIFKERGLPISTHKAMHVKQKK